MENESIKENSPFDILSLKSRASNVRDQILKEERGKEVCLFYLFKIMIVFYLLLKCYIEYAKFLIKVGIFNLC